jgi:hypothetical protein
MYSMYRLPKKSSDAMLATASIRGRTSPASSSTTVTRPTCSSRTAATRPLRTPDTTTGSPASSPRAFWNTTFTVNPSPPSVRPVSQNISPRKTATPTSTMAPTWTSCL